MSRKRTSPIWQISKEELQSVINTSNGITEVLDHFGLKHIGGNSRTLHTRCVEEGISLEEVKKRGVEKARVAFCHKSRIPLESLLVENSPYNRGHLKRRLINEGSLRESCTKCGLETTWQGEPLVLVLDHINGIRDDNRIENLRLLCPNCNSQTATFSGRKSQKRKTNPVVVLCEDCQSEISPRGRSTRCHRCAMKLFAEKRKELVN